MLRNKLSQFLAVAAVKVAENQVPDRIRDQLRIRKDALRNELNDYRSALANFIAPNQK